MWRTLHRRWNELGVESTPDLGDVFDRASVLVADNTSAMWEAASLDIPLVILDAPWYRLHVDHRLRFWEFADAGVRIGDPADLVGAVELALTDPPEVAQRRREAAEAVFAYRDGKAAQRAAEAILCVLRERSEAWASSPRG
jgi:CDP-glycerol glycerophosphotransferase (TagB/SpsB family)